MNDILITVIIPTYKRNESIDRAINSVLKQKGNFELIVVDDNDENTEYRKNNEKLMSKYKNISNFKYIRHKKNLNGAAARNTGISEARGEYITFLDDDDEFADNRIEVLEEYIRKKKYDFLCTGIIFKTGNEIVEKRKPEINRKKIKELQLELLNQKSFIGTGSNIVCKKELIKKINGFDDTFIRHQDIEFLIRYLEVTKTFYSIPEYLIIKNCDDMVNMPNYEKFLKIKEKFLSKFDYIIKELDEKTQKEILKNNYIELIRVAYFSGNKQDIVKSREFLKKNGIYDFKEDWILYAKSILKKNKTIKNIYRKMKSVKE